METKGSEIGRQGGLAEYEVKSWLNIDKNMWGFILGKQSGLAESEFKSWLGIDKNM